MESTERDLAMGDKSGGLGSDGGEVKDVELEVVTNPVIPEPEDAPVPPNPRRA